MKKRLAILLATAFTFATHNTFAANLIEVYQQALVSDPTFQAAQATLMANREALPINIAALLPSVAATGSFTREHTNQEITGMVTGPTNNPNIPNTPSESSEDFYNNSTIYNLSITQSIFNYSNWMKVKNAGAVVKQAEATFNAAAQNLMIQTATAYFNVLEAHESLQTLSAQRKALNEQLIQTEQRFKVGVIAITGVQQVKASYDSVVAQEIAAKNQLADTLEALRAITGTFYPNLAGLKKSMPLVSPHPADINRWVNVAAMQNYTLLAAEYAAEAAKDNIYIQASGHLPVVTANGGYNSDKESDPFGDGQTQLTNTASAGVTVNLPIYQGGLITAQTRQASYLYAQSSAQMETTYRQTVSQTRESYLGVISGISKIKADRQAIISNETSLKATQAAYMVGTNTLVDVLTQQSNLYNSILTYTQDQYAYLISTLQLKQAAGTLSLRDLAIINAWLGKQINFSSFDPTSSHYTAESAPLTNSAFNAMKSNFSNTLGISTTMGTSGSSVTNAPVSFQEPTTNVIHKINPIVSSSHEEIVLLKQNPKNYTIQLLATGDEKEVQEFIAQHQLDSKVRYFKTHFKNKNWYELIYGNYPTTEAADAELKKLPENIKQLKPWVRSISSVQTAILGQTP